jgi:hypothetical protein
VSYHYVVVAIISKEENVECGLELEHVLGVGHVRSLLEKGDINGVEPRGTPISAIVTLFV